MLGRKIGGPRLAVNPSEIVSVKKRRDIGPVIPDDLLSFLLCVKQTLPVRIDEFAAKAGALKPVGALSVAEHRTGARAINKIQHEVLSIPAVTIGHAATARRRVISMKVSTRVFSDSSAIPSCSVSMRRWGTPRRSKASLISG